MGLFRISVALSALVLANAALAQSTLTLEEARRMAREKQPSIAVRHEVTAAWLSAWAAAHTAALVRSLQSEYRRGIEAATISVAGGRATLGDVYAARQLLNQSEDRLLELAMQGERSTAELARWTGEPVATPGLATPQWRDPPPLPQLLAGLKAHPQPAAQQAAQYADLRTAYSEWQRSGERLANFDARILPDAQARVEALAVAYAAGRAELGVLLEARQALVESRIRRLAVELTRARARAALEHFERAEQGM